MTLPLILPVTSTGNHDFKRVKAVLLPMPEAGGPGGRMLQAGYLCSLEVTPWRGDTCHMSNTAFKSIKMAGAKDPKRMAKSTCNGH